MCKHIASEKVTEEETLNASWEHLMKVTKGGLRVTWANLN